MNVDWGLAGAVILSGLVIVFLILIVLIWIVMVTGKIVNKGIKKTEAPTASESKPVVPAAKPAVSAVPASPAVQSGIEEETVAAITAAVYTTLDAVSSNGDVAYAIKNISRATGGRPVWGFAGMQHNTRPF